MTHPALKRVCYWLSLLPMLLFVLGVKIGVPWLALGFFFLLLPLVRRFTGNDRSTPAPHVSRATSVWLRAIPRMYCLAWTGVLGWCVWHLASTPLSLAAWCGFTTSLWVITSLNLCIAHELIHARGNLDRLSGRMLAASVGYVHFAEEHAHHHARTGHAHGGDAAAPGATVYRYAFDRYRHSWTIAWNRERRRLQRCGQSWRHSALPYAGLVPIAIAGAFFYFAGGAGLACYLVQIVGAAFTLQVITYLQHWGLSERDTPELADYGFTWEDCCWMQACITLNHAYHGQHHLAPSRRFYELAPVQNGLQLPASYPVMFLLALYPRYFNQLMHARLEQWREHEGSSHLEDHTHDCLGLRHLRAHASGEADRA